MDSMVSRLSEELACPICHDLLSIPKTLPCQHSFCEGCLRDYCESRNFVNTGVFPCPNCRQDTSIPQGGISEIPTNCTIQAMVEHVRRADYEQWSQIQQQQQQQQQQQHPQQPTQQHSQPTPQYSQYQQPSQPQNQQYGQQQQQQQQQQWPQHQLPSQHQPTQQYSQLPTAQHGQYPHPHPVPPHYPQQPTAPPPIGFGVGRNPPERPPQPHVQRKLQLALDENTVPVKQNHHGASLCFGKYGSEVTDFTKPIGIATYRDTHILVSDARGNRIMIFQPDGKIARTFTVQGAVQGICMTERGDVLVANTRAERALAKAFTMTGQLRNSFGQQFTYETPHGVANRRDHIAVSTMETSKVYILDNNGRMLKEFGGKGSRKEQLRSPKHLGFMSNMNIVVADTGNSDVKIYDLQGKHKLTIGGPGSVPGFFKNPTGVAIDSQDNIYIADSGNHRIQCFNSKGKYLSTIADKIFGNSRGDGAVPTDLALLGQSRLVALVVGDRFCEVRMYNL